MTVQRGVLILAVALALCAAGNWWLQRPISHAAGVLVDAEPLQREPANPAPIAHGDYQLTPLADFDIEARVLSRENYSIDDGSDLSPTDLALGWKRMSDSAVIEQLEISQSVRFFTYRWSRQPPIPLPEIERSAANMHMIPADAGVARELAKVRQGALVHLRGQLVEARRSDGFQWRSSLTREDTGAGACELFLVASIERL
ncbi:MAG: hypothetical protein IPF61_05040 [Xanthomonadales bacterium]|jgi:hypothetical protein|nr:hypothetical protein [Xanthomonadales bacterium]